MMDVLMIEGGCYVSNTTGEIGGEGGDIYEVGRPRVVDTPLKEPINLTGVRCLDDLREMVGRGRAWNIKPLMVNNLVADTSVFRKKGVLSDKAVLMFAEIGMHCMYRNVVYFQPNDVMESLGIQRSLYFRYLRVLVKEGLLKDSGVKQEKGWKMMLVHPDYFYCSNSDRHREQDSLLWVLGGVSMGILHTSFTRGGIHGSTS